MKPKSLSINVGLKLACAALLITGIALSVPGVAQAYMPPTITVSNNLGESYDAYNDALNPGPVWLAAKFGASMATPFSYQLDSATLPLTKFTTDNYTAQVDIYSDTSGHPGTQIGSSLSQIGTIPVIADPTNSPLASDFGNIKFSALASGIGTLNSANTYWVVLQAIGTTPPDAIFDAGFGWQQTTSAAGTGWGRQPSFAFSTDGGTSWTDYNSVYGPIYGYIYSKMDVQATPAPATLLLLGTGLIGLVGYRKFSKKT